MTMTQNQVEKQDCTCDYDGAHVIFHREDCRYLLSMPAMHYTLKCADHRCDCPCAFCRAHRCYLVEADQDRHAEAQKHYHRLIRDFAA